MNQIFEHVPLYPLVFAVFWGAAVVFGLAMALWLRPPPAVEPPPLAQGSTR